MKQIFILLLTFELLACQQKTEAKMTQGEWIKGTEEEKLKIVEKQFRGFDNAMVETGYRYQELYWAGQDQNWEYASYQLEKIKLAIENGLQRRPKRAPSAEPFLNSTLPEMVKAVSQKDTSIFNLGFQSLTSNCNSCHDKEKLSFFRVKIPTVRQSPIRLPE